MAYNNYFPVGYQYYQPPVQPANSPQNGVVWVQGIEGAKAHPVAAGQSVLLMDSDSDCLYLKSANASGMPSLRVFDYKERLDTPQKPQNGDLEGFLTKDDLSDYATKDDLKTAISALEKKLKGKKKDE